MATVKPKDLKFEEAALQKRLEFVRSLKTALADEETLTSQTVKAYTLIIDGMLSEYTPLFSPRTRMFSDLPCVSVQTSSKR